MIEQLTVLNSVEDLKTLQKILNDVHNNAVGVTYYETQSVSSVNVVPQGKLVVQDDGTQKSAAVQSGKGNLVTLAVSGQKFVIENRTSDPASPDTGQIWLRTDL